jgi:hypothetical protein
VKGQKRDQWNAASAAYRAANLDLCRQRCRHAHYKRKYGITFDQWQEMFVAQGLVCAACGKDTPSTKKRGHGWHTDHNHETGVVRGILCFRCNIGIGYLEDRLFRANAKDYLEKHNG